MQTYRIHRGRGAPGRWLPTLLAAVAAVSASPNINDFVVPKTNIYTRYYLSYSSFTTCLFVRVFVSLLAYFVFNICCFCY